MTLTKRSLGKLISNEIALIPHDAEKLISDIFENISIELEKGREVFLFGFGTFKIKKKEARPGRNPITGEPHVITDRQVCVFKPGVLLKNASKKNAEQYSENLTN